MFDDYLDFCRAAGHRPATIRQRLYWLARVPNLDTATTRDLLAFLSSQDWAPETRSSIRGALRSYFHHLVLAGVRPDDPTTPLPVVRVPRGTPRPVPDDVLELAMIRGDDRERLMLGLAAYAGLRRAEIADLRWSAYAGGRLRIRGKGGAVRSVMVSRRLAELLDAEQGRRTCGRLGTGWRYGDPASLYVFPGRAGGPAAPYTIGDTLKRCLGPDWSGHKLRHRFASKAYRAQRDLFAVQQLLGHASPATTARYVELPSDAESAAVEAAAG